MASMAKRILALFGLAALALAATSAAHAESSASIVATQPAGDATLGRQESFWVRIEYNTNEAISLWARPYRSGAQVKKAMSNASLTYTGPGEALGWFALTEPSDVIDTTRDPTSHNLWPFEILQFGIVALAIVGGLELARRFMGVHQ